MKKYTFTLIISFIVAQMFAQQVPQFSQRMFDVMSYNPAIAGAKDIHEIKLHSRVQWVGFTDAPRTHMISYNGRIMKSSGIGAYLMADQTGPTRRNGFNLSYAHHIKFDRFNLALGASSLLSQFSFDTDVLRFHESGDMVVAANNIKSKLSPDFTFGTFAYNRKFFFGASATQFIKTQLNTSDTPIPSTQQYYLMGGYNVSKNAEWSLLPSFVATFAKNYPWQGEFNFRAEYMGKYLGGVSVRTEDAMVGMVGMRFTRQIFAIYSFDLLYSKLRHYNAGSHEVIIYFEFNGKPRPPMFFLDDNDTKFLPHWY